MAGILANSVSQTMTSGDESVDNAVSGYLTQEQITLSVLPSATSFDWEISQPSGSTARSNLNQTTASTAQFTPDVGGLYAVTVTVDGTTIYIIRISVTQVAVTTSLEAIRFSPKADSEVVAPAVGEAMYFSSTPTPNRLRVKDTAGVVRDIDPSQRTGTFTLSSGTATVTDATVTAGTIMVVMMTTASSPGFLTFAVTAGVDIVITSSDGSDASTLSYALIG